MKMFVIVVLAIFWAAMAFRSYQRDDLMMAGVFILVGVALTVYRLRK